MASACSADVVVPETGKVGRGRRRCRRSGVPRPPPLPPILCEPAGGRSINTHEYERIFQIVRGDHRPEAMCYLARRDIADGLDVAQVMARIKEQDARKRENNLRAGYEPLGWRCPLDKPGRPGEHSTIATSCVLVGLEDYPARRPRSAEVLKHLLDIDPELAWGRMRFPDNQTPTMPIVVACTRARPDIVRAMTEHPSAEKFLPTNAKYDQTPVPGGRVVDLIAQTARYNEKQRAKAASGADNADDAQTITDRQECINILKRLHQRRHVAEQSMLEDILNARLNFGASEVDLMCSNLLTYTHSEIPRAPPQKRLLGANIAFLPSTPADADVLCADGKRRARECLCGPCHFGHTTTTAIRGGVPRWARVPQPCPWPGMPRDASLCQSCYRTALAARKVDAEEALALMQRLVAKAPPGAACHVGVEEPNALCSPEQGTGWGCTRKRRLSLKNGATEVVIPSKTGKARRR